MSRKGMMVGTGKKGYHNVVGRDPAVHSQSAKGIKQPQRVNVIPNMRVSGWGQIDNSKDSTKEWITAEFSTKTTNVSDSKSILVYDDNEAGYGWRVWIGATIGSDKGTYHSFPSKEKALKFAKDYMYDYERSGFYQKMSDKIERANTQMQKRRDKTYKVSVPPTMEMGSYSTNVKFNKFLSKEQEALWHYNSAREHDGLEPLKKMPKGTKYTKN